MIAADADKVDVTATATYDEKNVGNRTVDYSAIALTGDEANNYSLTHTTATLTVMTSMPIISAPTSG